MLSAVADGTVLAAPAANSPLSRRGVLAMKDFVPHNLRQHSSVITALCSSQI